MTAGSYSGVGIEVSADDGRVVVVTPIEGSPAARAGVRSGDVDHRRRWPARHGRSSRRHDQPDARLRRLERAPGRRPHRRAGAAAVHAATLAKSTCTACAPKRCPAAMATSASRSSATRRRTTWMRRSPEACAATAQRRALRGLVLDLRGNPGGVLESAVSVADAFLEDGLIVRADGRTPEARFEMDAYGRRPARGPAHRRAGRRRLGVGLGDRRGRAARPRSRHADGRAHVRQGLGADGDPAARRPGAEADDVALFHAVGHLDPRARPRARHRDRRPALRTTPGAVRCPPESAEGPGGAVTALQYLRDRGSARITRLRRVGASAEALSAGPDDRADQHAHDRQDAEPEARAASAPGRARSCAGKPAGRRIDERRVPPPSRRST